MYKNGLYGGAFNPMHNGHLRCILQAAAMCETLWLVLSVGNKRDEIDERVRYRWLFQAAKHVGNARILTIRDDGETKADYPREKSLEDTAWIREQIGEPVDIVFCGSDYDENSFWRKNYPESEFHVFQRDEISSTLLRQDIYGHWDWLPTFVRPYFVKKVLIIGVESSGKSTLTVSLAKWFNTNYIEEAGRELSEKSGTDLMMLDEDFTEILLTHKLNEMKAVEQSNKVLFCDTDCLVTQFYLRFLDGSEDNLRLSEALDALNHYDLVLFLAPDVKWVQDGDRSEEIRDNREKYRDMMMEIYRKHDRQFHYIEGDYLSRLNTSVSLVKELLHHG